MSDAVVELEVVQNEFGPKELAKALGVTRQTIWNWRRKEDSPKNFDLPDWIKYRDKMAEKKQNVPHSIYRPTETDDTPESAEFRRLRLRLLEAQTGKEAAVRKLRELELQRVSQELVPMNDAREVLRSKIEPLRQLLEALPTAAAAMANPQNPFIAEKAIQTHVEKILRILSEQET